MIKHENTPENILKIVCGKNFQKSCNYGVIKGLFIWWLLLYLCLQTLEDGCWKPRATCFLGSSGIVSGNGRGRRTWTRDLKIQLRSEGSIYPNYWRKFSLWLYDLYMEILTGGMVKSCACFLAKEFHLLLLLMSCNWNRSSKCSFQHY